MWLSLQLSATAGCEPAAFFIKTLAELTEAVRWPSSCVLVRPALLPARSSVFDQDFAAISGIDGHPGGEHQEIDLALPVEALLYRCICLDYNNSSSSW